MGRSATEFDQKNSWDVSTHSLQHNNALLTDILASLSGFTGIKKRQMKKIDATSFMNLRCSISSYRCDYQQTCCFWFSLSLGVPQACHHFFFEPRRPHLYFSKQKYKHLMWSRLKQERGNRDKRQPWPKQTTIYNSYWKGIESHDPRPKLWLKDRAHSLIENLPKNC
jgi:hypothetical protein